MNIAGTAWIVNSPSDVNLLTGSPSPPERSGVADDVSCAHTGRVPLLHLLAGPVAIARNNVIFQLLVLLILNAQGMAFVVDKLHT